MGLLKRRESYYEAVVSHLFLTHYPKPSLRASTSTTILCACAVDAKAVACLEHVRVTAGLVDLFVLASP
jgi:hypothetical protein